MDIMKLFVVLIGLIFANQLVGALMGGIWLAFLGVYVLTSTRK